LYENLDGCADDGQIELAEFHDQLRFFFKMKSRTVDGESFPPNQVVVDEKSLYNLPANLAL
jgi:hypothetical protein